jgi:hypothetical protein
MNPGKLFPGLRELDNSEKRRKIGADYVLPVSPTEQHTLQELHDLQFAW